MDIANVNLSGSYTLTPTEVEILAGTVFTESIQAIGIDKGTANDKVISNFPPQSCKVNEEIKSVDRTISIVVNRIELTEDPGFTAKGSEQSDEVFARVTITSPLTRP